jgi:hypothetical protein
MVRGRVGIAWLAAACVLGAVARGTASADEPRHFGAQRTLGFGPVLGFDGTGATVTGQLDVVGLWITGGYAPLLIGGNKNDSLRTPTFDFYSSGQIDVDVSILVLRPTPKLDAELLLGYRYNTVLAHGVGVGGVMILDLTPALAGFIAVEPQIFPDGQAQLTGAGYPSDRAASIPWFQGSGSIGLLVYP